MANRLGMTNFFLDYKGACSLLAMSKQNENDEIQLVHTGERREHFLKRKNEAYLGTGIVKVGELRVGLRLAVERDDGLHYLLKIRVEP